MKAKISILTMALALAVTPVAMAQQPPGGTNCPRDCPMHCPQAGAGMRGGGGWSTGPYSRIYDPKTVETLKGEVVKVDHVAPMRGMSEGIHVAVKTDTGTTDVHLGPAWYLDHQDIQLAVGDRVEVRGSKVNIDGKPAVVAAEVKKGSETLQLRDAQGFPMWRGWR
jgi:hypothetical protein